MQPTINPGSAANEVGSGSIITGTVSMVSLLSALTSALWSKASDLLGRRGVLIISAVLLAVSCGGLALVEFATEVSLLWFRRCGFHKCGFIISVFLCLLFLFPPIVRLRLQLVLFCFGLLDRLVELALGQVRNDGELQNMWGAFVR